MARHENVNWNLPAGEGGAGTPWNAVFAALLMDLRDELQKLNRLLGCSNFLGIPQTLRDIRDGITTHYCTRCLRGFKTPRGLRQHQRVVHRD